MTTRSHYPSHCRGFTLLEILAATTISIVLLGLLLAATSGALDSLQQTRSHILRNGDASLAIDQILLDIECLTDSVQPGSEILRITPETVQAATPVWLTLVSAAVDQDNSNISSLEINGAPRAISYRLGYQNPIDGTSSDSIYGIYRSIASADDTFNNSLNLNNLQSGYWSSTSGTNTPTSISNFLAPNVVRFYVTIEHGIDTNSDGVSDVWQWTSTSDTVSITSDNIIINGTTTYPRDITAIEIAVTTISPTGMTRLASNAMTLDEVILKFGTTTIRQISTISNKAY